MDDTAVFHPARRSRSQKKVFAVGWAVGDGARDLVERRPVEARKMAVGVSGNRERKRAARAVGARRNGMTDRQTDRKTDRHFSVNGVSMKTDTRDGAPMIYMLLDETDD
mmetsp:Transcript_12942/g.30863  ORF Transcript_12942/g.30863 Transcript_12942/m.30863 type:complete len:109 (+) Transcript_12942:1208-1534(+)